MCSLKRMLADGPLLRIFPSSWRRTGKGYHFCKSSRSSANGVSLIKPEPFASGFALFADGVGRMRREISHCAGQPFAGAKGKKPLACFVRNDGWVRWRDGWDPEPARSLNLGCPPPEIALYSRLGSFVRAHRVVFAAANKREVSVRHPAME